MPLLFGTSKINEKNHLEIGGCDSVELVKKYGTPLYVYDVELIRNRARGFKKTFDDLGMKNKVTYASKAFACLALYQIISQEGLACDVVSGGELYMALQAGIAPDKIAFHGNNKTPEELSMAVDSEVGTIMLDNFYEIEILSEILVQKQKTQKVMLRVSPGVDAHTHKFILTGQEDSKFGFDVKSGQAEKAFQLVNKQPVFELLGIHCHIGSQIFDTEGFQAAANKMMNILVEWKKKFDYVAQALNLGGGFGVHYTAEDDPLKPEEYVKEIAKILQQVCKENHYPLPEIWIEPGRSIVAEAGTTLYTIGSRKDIPGIRSYVAVDGGMGENIRPALYEAKYQGFLANRKDLNEEVVTITGKYCESADMLIHDLSIPKVQPGDILAITSTGAYGYSMASNYNSNGRPAVIFVENGKSQLVIKRETFEDLTKLQIPLDL